GLPLSFHVGETFDARGQGGLATTIVVAFQPFRRLFALLAFAGIFERNPGIRVVFTEGGISWVPSALFDCDKVYASFESEMTPKLAKPPSHYWFENCYATFIEDPSGLRQLDLIGVDKVLWGSDYPHPESAVGYTQQSLWDVFDATDSVEDAQKIVGGNAQKVWGLT
ncbi:MAG: amidohydrolase family protein, partial [Chloroflexi bacterium]|nr:amidohydrolase family protein [Chloroflexota bacterium]